MSWTMLARFDSVGEAESARSALEAAGIPVEIADEETVGMNWLYSNAIGGVKLYVDDADRDDSAAVISTPAESVPDEEPVPESAPAPLACPACGKTLITRTPRLVLFLFFSLALLGVGVAVNQLGMAAAAVVALALIMLIAPSHRCASCGERWNAPETPGDAPPPNPGDEADVQCARCGSLEVHRIEYRRLKAVPLLFYPLIFPIAAIWFALPKWRCGNCGFKGHVVNA